MAHFEEIGGNFPVVLGMNSEVVNSEDTADLNQYFSSGRSAILATIIHSRAQGKKVALPYFTCHSVIESFVRMGCEIKFYPIQKDLKVQEDLIIQFCQVEQPYLFFYHDYFGLNEELKWSKIFDVCSGQQLFVNDKTHSFFSASTHSSAHYTLMSIRKWGGISEGGCLQINGMKGLDIQYDIRPDNDFRMEIYNKASELKREFLQGDPSINKEQFRSLFYQSESFFDSETGIYPIRLEALQQWRALLRSPFAQRRKLNLDLLVQGWNPDWEGWGIPIFMNNRDVVPLYFPILLKIQRSLLQSFLASHGVYAPIIWPKSILITQEGDDSFYNQLLCIPIDQRYGEKDMNRILSLFEAFDKMMKG